MRKVSLTLIPLGLLTITIAGCSKKQSLEHNSISLNAAQAKETNVITSTSTPVVVTIGQTSYAPDVSIDYQIDHKGIDNRVCEGVAKIQQTLTDDLNQNPNQYNTKKYLESVKNTVTDHLGNDVLYEGKIGSEQESYYPKSPFLAWAKTIVNYWINGSAYNPNTKKYDEQYQTQLNNFKKICSYSWPS